MNTELSATGRRAQPIRQARTNPPRMSSLSRDDGNAAVQGQPIDIFPAVTHFADVLTALPKELIRHFTLVKEVDAKIYVSEEELFQLIDTALNAPQSDSACLPDGSSSDLSPGIERNTDDVDTDGSGLSVPSDDEVSLDALCRRQLFRQAAFKMQEMLVSLEEKNHVLNTTNDALQKQIARIEDLWPHLENEFSDEAKWGSTTHWAYLDNRLANASNAQAERSRREGAATLSAAAQQLAEDAAARGNDKKKAISDKKSSKTQGAGECDARSQDPSLKKGQGGSKSRKPLPVEFPAAIGPGLSAITQANGSAALKRRKVESKGTNGTPADRSIGGVLGNAAVKARTTSPRETPVPENMSKKRKALPAPSSQAKKSKTGTVISSTASSPVVGPIMEIPKIGRTSPAPSGTGARPASSRTRKNSNQGAQEVGRPRTALVASGKPAVHPSPMAPDPSLAVNTTRPEAESLAVKEAQNGAKVQTANKTQSGGKCQSNGKAQAIGKPESGAIKVDLDSQSNCPDTVFNGGRKEAVAKVSEDREAKREAAPPALPLVPAAASVTTKSGRASKPSTPALATFAEAGIAVRPRPTRNMENSGMPVKRSHKKGASSISAVAAATSAAQQALHGVKQNHDDEGEADVDEPRYCYCDGVSYGEMVACDDEACPREWFHLGCVGLKVAPKGNAKWYCDDCKKRSRTSDKKAFGR